MIGKISIGKSFYGCISYCFDTKEKNKYKIRGKVLYTNNCFGTKFELIKQFKQVARLNKRCLKPVWHTTISFAKDDKIQEFQKIEIAQSFAKEFQFTDNQYLVIEHYDTNHEHFHIILNRVSLEGKTVSTSKNYKRMAEFSRKIELEYNLTKVLNPRVFLNEKERSIKRYDTRKEKIKEDIKQASKNSCSLNNFIGNMEALGHDVIKGRGISFIDSRNVKVKGSEVGFSLKSIMEIINQNLKNQQSITQTRTKKWELKI